MHTQTMDATTPAIAARGGHPGPEWQRFMRALAAELDDQIGAQGRDELLRGVGRRLARLLPLPDVTTLDALQIEMNDALDSVGLGSVQLALRETERVLLITHSRLPRVGGAGDPPGMWLSAALEGLYDSWIGQQHGSDPSLIAERFSAPTPDTLVLRYRRA